jgi:hypothetical protein
VTGVPEGGDSRKRKHGRRPWLRLDRWTVEPMAEQAGPDRYRVRIEGVNLRGAVSPPRITVGGQLLRALRFEPDGRAVTGEIDQPPEHRRVIVDYGFARAELDDEPG